MNKNNASLDYITDYLMCAHFSVNTKEKQNFLHMLKHVLLCFMIAAGHLFLFDRLGSSD